MDPASKTSSPKPLSGDENATPPTNNPLPFAAIGTAQLAPKWYSGVATPVLGLLLRHSGWWPYTNPATGRSVVRRDDVDALERQYLRCVSNATD